MNNMMNINQDKEQHEAKRRHIILCTAVARRPTYAEIIVMCSQTASSYAAALRPIIPGS